MSQDTMAVLKDTYNRILEDAIMYQALVAAGVGDWDGYNAALSIYEDTMYGIEEEE